MTAAYQYDVTYHVIHPNERNGRWLHAKTYAMRADADQKAHELRQAGYEARVAEVKTP